VPTDTRPRIVVLEDWNQQFDASPHVARLRQRADVVVHTDHAPDAATVIARLAGAKVAVCNRERTRLDAAFFEALPGLVLVAQTGHGTMHVDLAAATANRTLVAVTPGGAVAAVIELTIGLMIASMRRVAEQDRALRAGQWTNYVGAELHGKTLGIVGAGYLGSRVGHMAKLFGMRVLAAGITLTPERAATAGFEFRTLDDLLAEADVVSLHLKLAERTRGIIDASRLARMKPTAILINTSRGPLVDEGALVAALRSRRIAGAALDVYDQEPLPPNHPLLSCETALLTAHTGWVTDAQYERFLSGVVENIEAYLAGRPIHVVNPEARPDLPIDRYVVDLTPASATQTST
jgi:phosphoglycerate dehydrogenase-like enzyme